MKCMMGDCTNEAKPGRSACEKCLQPYVENGVIVHPPDISEETYIQMCQFFAKARRNRR